MPVAAPPHPLDLRATTYLALPLLRQVEMFGILNLFGNFVPALVNLIKSLPVVGPILTPVFEAPIFARGLEAITRLGGGAATAPAGPGAPVPRPPPPPGGAAYAPSGWAPAGGGPAVWGASPSEGVPPPPLPPKVRLHLVSSFHVCVSFVCVGLFFCITSCSETVSL